TPDAPLIAPLPRPGRAGCAAGVPRREGGRLVAPSSAWARAVLLRLAPTNPKRERGLFYQSPRSRFGLVCQASANHPKVDWSYEAAAGKRGVDALLSARQRRGIIPPEWGRRRPGTDRR